MYFKCSFKKKDSVQNGRIPLLTKFIHCDTFKYRGGFSIPTWCIQTNRKYVRGQLHNFRTQVVKDLLFLFNLNKYMYLKVLRACFKR